MGPTLIATIVVFLIVLLLLVALLLFAKAKLSPSGKVKVTINGERTLEVDGGNGYNGEEPDHAVVQVRWSSESSRGWLQSLR